MKISRQAMVWNATQAASDDDNKRTRGGAAGRALLWLGRSLEAVVYAIEIWQRNRKAMNELAQCSDWTLADIGIRREQIGEAVRVGAARPKVRAATPAKPTLHPAQANNNQVRRKVA